MREGASTVQSHPQPHGGFKTNLGYMKVKRGVKVVLVHGLTVLVLCSKPNIIDKNLSFCQVSCRFSYNLQSKRS